MRDLRHGSSQPNQVNRDELYIQHDPNSNKVLGIWAGSKNDKRKVLVNKAAKHGGDGADVALKPEDRYAGLDTTTAIATATLPDVSDIDDGHVVTIKDEGGNATNNNITVATNGSESVETGTIATNGAVINYLWDEANSNWIDIS